MTASFMFALAGAAVFVIAFHAVIVQDHLLRKIVALNLMGSGVFLIIAGVARRAPGTEADPVPHALVITGIVVAVAATALAIALMLRLHGATGRPELSAADRS